MLIFFAGLCHSLPSFSPACREEARGSRCTGQAVGMQDSSGNGSSILGGLRAAVLMCTIHSAATAFKG